MKKEENGTRNITKKQGKVFVKLVHLFVNNAENLLTIHRSRVVFVQIPVKQNGEEVKGWIMKKEFVLYVARNLKQINSKNKRPVVGVAGTN